MQNWYYSVLGLWNNPDATPGEVGVALAVIDQLPLVDKLQRVSGCARLVVGKDGVEGGKGGQGKGGKEGRGRRVGDCVEIHSVLRVGDGLV